MGRTSKPQQLIEHLQASEAARERTKAMLLTLCGHWEVKDALARLCLSRTRFQMLRQRMLEGAVQALEPGAMGRPRKLEPQDARLRELDHEVDRLRGEVRRLRTRLELAEGPLALAVMRRLTAQGRKAKTDREGRKGCKQS